MKSRYYALFSASLAAIAATSVQAQTAPASAPAPAPVTPVVDSSAPAEIIVTAQKRAEPLQKVPVAITVVSGDAMSRLSTNNIEDTQKLVPALTFVKGDTSLNSALFLRGLGTVSFSIAAEPSVTSVLDGVVLARAGESFGDLYDIDRVEVLRGPQGTLFGKNASAGVINIVTKEPGKTLGGYMDVEAFTGGEYKVKASISGPISENWRAGVTAFYSDYKGNIWDSTTHSKINGYKHYGVRGQLIGDVGNLHIKAIADYRKSDDDCCAFVIGGLNNTSTGSSAANKAIESILPPALYGATRQSIQSLPNHTNEETYGGSIQADLALGSHTLTSITSFRQWNNEEIRDGDWVDQVYRQIPLIHDDGPEKSHTFTQELRLTSPTGGFVDYVIGAFYYQAVAARTYTRTDTYCTATTAATLPNGLTPCPAAQSTIVNPSGTGVFGSTFYNAAAYGQATWHFAPTFRLVTGLRYTHDKVTAYDTRTDNFTTQFYPGLATAPGGIGANFDANVAAAGNTTGAGFNGTPWRGSASADNVSGKAALEYDLAPHNMVYASYARGYKGPAFNVFYNMQYFNTAPISPETSNAFEAGLKNSFMGGRVIFNIDGFYTKVYNYQANYPTTVNGTVTTTIINAGKVSTRGAEAELLIRPTRNFTINAGYSYTDARVDQFNEPPATQAVNYITPGTPLAFAPKNKGNVGATYTAEVPGLPFAIEFNALGSYTSKQISTLAATNTADQIAAYNAQIIAGYAQVDASIAAVDLGKHYRISAVVKNLFNNHYASTIGTGGPGGSYIYQIPRDSDRYFGATLRYNF